VVRVYERSDRPRGQFYLSRAWMRTPSGRPVEEPLPEGMDWDRAKVLCDLTASARKKELLGGRDSFGERKRATLRDVIRAYHKSAVAEGWSEKTRIDKRLGREFWLGALNPEMDFERITPAEVLRLAHAEADRRGLEVTKVIKLCAYLRAVSLWSYNKARLISENPLRGIELPAYNPDTTPLVYTMDEARLLITPHDDIDWRVTLAASIALYTGRRINSIRLLRVFGDVMLKSRTSAEIVVLDETDDWTEIDAFGNRIRAELELQEPADRGRVILHFVAETDKGRRARLVPVPPSTGLLVADAICRTEVAQHGWLLPGGYPDRIDQLAGAYSKPALTRALHRAEAVLGIKSVPNRAFHGLKRRHVTKSMELAHGDTALVGDVTGNRSAALLQHVYRQLDEERIEKHMDTLEAEVEG